jgi:very-short-patch-repair endonuclease
MSAMTEVSHVEVAMRPQRNTPEWELALLAGRQHGVVAHSQARALGFSAAAIQRRIRNGHLHPLHRGVYAVGHRKITVTGRWMAAVLACGPGALLSHRSAAAHHGLLPTSRRQVDVTTYGNRRGGRGVVLHRTRRLDAADRDEREGIPVTSVMRTIADLADVVRPDRLQRAVDAAEHRGLFDLDALPDLRGRKGGGRLERLLGAYREPPPTNSEFERRFSYFCRQHGLTQPDFNVEVEGFLVDAVWRDAKFVVELDSYGHHGTRTSFEEDRRRDMKLQAVGYRVLRITYRRLMEEPATVLHAIRSLLSNRDER